MNNEYIEFYTVIMDLVKKGDTFENKKKFIEEFYEFRKLLTEHLNQAYDRGLLEGGYAMNRIKNEYEHRRASP
tara:strand:- start:1273 stop:1491 length:219 start_codon:yes stop_codon:yes gene_type:complete